jgi:hypothetical protein
MTSRSSVIDHAVRVYYRDQLQLEDCLRIIPLAAQEEVVQTVNTASKINARWGDITDGNGRVIMRVFTPNYDPKLLGPTIKIQLDELKRVGSYLLSLQNAILNGKARYPGRYFDDNTLAAAIAADPAANWIAGTNIQAFIATLSAKFPQLRGTDHVEGHEELLERVEKFVHEFAPDRLIEYHRSTIGYVPASRTDVLPSGDGTVRFMDENLCSFLCAIEGDIVAAVPANGARTWRHSNGYGFVCLACTDPALATNIAVPEFGGRNANTVMPYSGVSSRVANALSVWHRDANAYRFVGNAGCQLQLVGGVWTITMPPPAVAGSSYVGFYIEFAQDFGLQDNNLRIEDLIGSLNTAQLKNLRTIFSTDALDVIQTINDAISKGQITETDNNFPFLGVVGSWNYQDWFSSTAVPQMSRRGYQIMYDWMCDAAIMLPLLYDRQ